MDLKVKNRSNHQNNVKYEFLDPKTVKIDILYSILGQTVEKLIFEMADGGHLGFWRILTTSNSGIFWDFFF